MSALATMLSRQFLPRRWFPNTLVLRLNLFSVSDVVRKHTIIQHLMRSRLRDNRHKPSYDSSLRSDFRLLHFVSSPSAPTIPLESKLYHLTKVFSAKSRTCLDNAVVESFFSSLKPKCVYRHSCKSKNEAKDTRHVISKTSIIRNVIIVWINRLSPIEKKHRFRSHTL